MVEKQKQNSNKEEDTAGDASDLIIGEGEENEDPTPGTKVCTQFCFLFWCHYSFDAHGLW